MVKRIKRFLIRKLQSKKGAKVSEDRIHKGIEGIEVFQVGETCRMLGILVPGAYKGRKKEHVSNTDLFETLENKNEVLEQIVTLEKRNEEQYKESRKAAKKFTRLFHSTVYIKPNDTDLLKRFVEWQYGFAPLGFNVDNYFDYRLYEKTMEEAKTFVDKRFVKERLIQAYFPKRGKRAGIKYLRNKKRFNSLFSKYVNRAFLDTRDATLQEFEAFLTEHPRFFAKPAAGSLGAGIEIIEYSSGDDAQKLFNYCQEKGMLIEEIIPQHPELAEFNPETVNSMRITALFPITGEPIITAAVVRFGRPGSAVDNVSQGGMVANIDLATGKINTPAFDRNDNQYEIHPESRKEIVGFQIPHWDRVVAAIKEGAAMMPGVRHIGWDLTVTKDGNVEFIEGNSSANFRTIHLADQIGKKHFYEKFVNEIEEYKAKYPEKANDIYHDGNGRPYISNEA